MVNFVLLLCRVGKYLAFLCVSVFLCNRLNYTSSSLSLFLAVVGIWNEENVRHGYVEVSFPGHTAVYLVVGY